MKNLVSIFIVCTLSVQSNVLFSQALEANFSHATFFSADKGSYVETYFLASGEDLHYISVQDSLLQACVEITMLFKNADKIKEFRKYKVVTPIISDTTTIFKDIIDLQRIIIPQGVYNFELIARDIYAPDSVLNFQVASLIHVIEPGNEPAISGVEFLDSYKKADKTNIFVKHDFECIPLGTNSFEASSNYMKIYFELYNISKEVGPLEDFIINYRIEAFNTSKPIKAFSAFQVQQALNLNTVFKEVNIAKLAKGNYFLIIEITNKNNDILLKTTKYFSRESAVSFKFNDTKLEKEVENNFVELNGLSDSIQNFINMLNPISDSAELTFIRKNLDSIPLDKLEKYFYNFWVQRDSKNPQLAWQSYYTKVCQVNAEFSTANKPGYLTDKGRVYLQYGIPNSLSKAHNTLDKQHEIWHYYKLADLSDVKFVFGESKDDLELKLLHSNMPGEKYVANWRSQLEFGSNPSIKEELKKDSTEGDYFKKKIDEYR
jgi:GWxTD domain-containing protein